MSLDISLSDIARLSDASLRSLVVRLCEAELRAAALPTVHLTAGGAQDAPDGGIDVRVAAPATLGASGWIPRGDTGFQVKTTAMSPSALRAEMRPSTALRPSIADLLASGGAYVIVSAQTSPTDSELRRRLAAMREAAGNGATATGVLDFYGGDRLALWCRSHPGVLTWARAGCGTSGPGLAAV